MTATRVDHVRAYDAIAILDTIARVGTSRAATWARARERILGFAPEILAQVEESRAAGAPEADAEERAAARDRLVNLLTDLVLAELRALPQRGIARAGSMSPELLARYVASTFVLVLDWWEESGTAVPAREANEYFRSLVLRALG